MGYIGIKISGFRVLGLGFQDDVGLVEKLPRSGSVPGR